MRPAAARPGRRAGIDIGRNERQTRGERGRIAAHAHAHHERRHRSGERRVKHERLFVRPRRRGPGRSRARRPRSRTTAPRRLRRPRPPECGAGYRRRAPIGDPLPRRARERARERLVDDHRSGSGTAGRPRGSARPATIGRSNVSKNRRSHRRRPKPTSRTLGPAPATASTSRRSLGPARPRRAVGERDRDHAGFLRDAPLELRERPRPPRLERRRGLLVERPVHDRCERRDTPGLEMPARMFSLRIAWLAPSMATGMPMAVSATCAIIAPVQTRPKRSVAPPVPRFARCDCTRARVTLSAGRNDSMRRADDREAAGIQDRRELQAGRHPERCAALALLTAFDPPRQRPVGGDEADRGRDRPRARGPPRRVDR